MKYIDINGKKYSSIGLGTARYGTIISEENAFELLDCFVDYGGNFIDTARNYYSWGENGRGISEKTIGRWISLRGHRDMIRICTKGGMTGEGKDSLVNLSRKNLFNELNESLEALQTDYLDVYLLHKDETDRPVGEIMETLMCIKDTVKADIIGVSNWKIDRIKEANKYAESHSLDRISAVSTMWSIAEYTQNFWDDPRTTGMDHEMYTYMLDEGLLAIAFSSQAKGFFQKAIKYGVENLDPFLLYRVGTENNKKRVCEIKDYCDKFGIPPTAVVTGYITDNRLNGIALVGCNTIEQLKDILESCDETIDNKWIEQFDV